MVESFGVLENILFLKKNTLFSAMDTRELRAVASICRNDNFRCGEKIVIQGELGETMYLIKSGTVSVTRANEFGSVDLATLTPGDNFGEMAMFDTELRSATVTALEKCSMLSIDQKDLMDLLHSFPEIALAIIKIFAARLRVSNERVELVSQEKHAAHFADAVS